jgi:hypothetical protein
MGASGHREVKMRRLTLGTAIGTILVLLAASGAVTAPRNRNQLFREERHRLRLAKMEFQGGQKSGSARNMVVVGHEDLGGRGFNADVWYHQGYAYVGRWGFTDWAQGAKQRFCPKDADNGIAVVDVTPPSNPQMIGQLKQPPGTSVEDVVVYEAPFGPRAGRDIAVGGIQVCGGSRYNEDFKRGVMLWDVTNPAAPQTLGFFNTGCCTRGVHEFEVAHRTDLGRTFAYATVPASRYPDPITPSGVRDADGADGDFRLIDITNPNPGGPFQASTWWVQLAGGPFDAQGCDPDGNFGHGAEPTADGKAVFLAYWDSGFIKLDLTNPSTPVFQGRTDYPPNADGDGHSSQFDETRNLLFTADEDFCLNSGPSIEKGYGYLRVYNYSNPASPTQIGSYRTPNSITGGRPGSGDYTIHNNFFVESENRLYIAWYSDGVRAVDVSNPASPQEVAFFVPPASQNPVKPSQRGVLSQTPQVWGVVYDEEEGLVYASDMNSGLWILDATV